MVASKEIENLVLYEDEVAEWLRRWTANPLGNARVGSNPILVEFCNLIGVMVKRWWLEKKLKMWFYMRTRWPSG